jgi:pimeloyl-ACP methyl ester carboxylesterase
LTSRRLCRLGLAVIAAASVASAAVAPSAGAATGPAVSVEWMRGYSATGTPTSLNRVGVVEIGPPKARNVLVLEPGTSAGGAYFVPLAKWLVTKVKGWQVWSVERRENLLEDQSVLNLAKQGRATPQQLFDYYLGYLSNPSITNHFHLIGDSTVAFARQWGMHVAVEDLHRVIEAAKQRGGRVVLGGHSLGGSVVTAYATWDFNGRAGAADLAGLVYDDGGSKPAPVSARQATKSLQELQNKSPWLSFGGITAPFAGLYNATGATNALIDPNGPSLGQAFPLLPADLKPPVPVTNLAQYGYALDAKTSPRSLIAAQAHLGLLAASGNPRGWDSTGALTPINRFAQMFSGTGLENVDGTEWYFPMRLTIDTGAVAEGNANPAQAVLDVHATHGHDLPRGLRIYAFGAALGGPGVLAAATVLANQSHISLRNLTLMNRQSTYAHNDPASAYPHNDFFSHLVQFLTKIVKHD